MIHKPSPIWHPFTQHGLMQEILPVERAEGAYLYTNDGRRIIDAISSWWVVTHGHCHPKIVMGVREQARKLDQVIFAGFTHEPAERLAEKLVCHAPEGLSRVFYSDSGSTAVEVALKMAIGYFAQTGQARRKILALEGGYHGDTFGAMSAGGRSAYNALYEPYLFEVTHLPFPESGQEEWTFSALEKLLKQSGDDIAAFIFEPLVQGAGGMRFYSAEVLAQMAKMCRAHGILLIADEVMTGFGRTGTLFACEQAGLAPDLLCLSKGLTGGFLPMGATLATEAIYRAFYHKDRAKMFFHSTSFTGNPLSCVAALASLTIWEQEPVMERIAAINQTHRKAAAHFGGREDVENVRFLGSIFALDVRDEGGGYLSDLQPFLYQTMLSRNVLLRPLGNSVYILPPYCVTQRDLDTIYECIDFALDRLRDERQKQVA
ncbi:MAG: adenosylmethionine--8-amino-7-oxononanoate transaminase [Alphaproteobacteria bacterium]|nr:adenosylmethionine--8-amino-7-oxononanoate transaminase [Alphaproteobacteria bacterium]QQS57441.1 MAG: adenosylmethionine--8-amino-7-oxononanoate transaminase [Alphaproteobacteria bacterium]